MEATLPILRGRSGRGDLAGNRSRTAIALAHLGRVDEALESARRAIDLMGVNRESVINRELPGLAEVEVMVGNYDDAIEHLRTCLSEPSILTAQMLRVDPLWDPLREHPGFQALLAEYDDVAQE